MTRDVAWTAREVKLLREVQHLSQRAFAEHLGFAQSSIANWEKVERKGGLHHETREVLDRELAGLPSDVRDRFDRRLGTAPGKLGTGSAVRTSTLLQALNTDADSPIPYCPPARIIDDFRAFHDSSARVFLLRGAAGTGKTRLTQYLASYFAKEIDVQLLTVANWDLSGVDVAVEILRYASIPRGQDALLTLENHCEELPRQCVVVIDGLTSHNEFNVIGRQVDAILRQVTIPSLRFLLVVRTPPAVETTAHPLLHAAVFSASRAPDQNDQTELSPWTLAETRSRWDQARTSHAPSFDALPMGIQQLVRTPIYMRLALTASLGSTGHDLNAYALLDHSVRTIIGRDAPDMEDVLAALTELAYRQYHDQLPAALSASATIPADNVGAPHLPRGVASSIATANVGAPSSRTTSSASSSSVLVSQTCSKPRDVRSRP